MRKQIAAANWKMNLSLQQAHDLVEASLNEQQDLQDHQAVIFGVPFPYLKAVKEQLNNKPNYFIAAQNCHFKTSGAYTGEVSVEMLKSVNADYVIVGHSERREYFNENNQMIAEKLNVCFDAGLNPIFCCGEPLSIREAETQNDYVEQQLRDSIFHLNEAQLGNLVIAYEPIWAIGTGKTATSAQAEEIHSYIRNVLCNQFGDAVADNISILYGGSVKASNAKEIFSKANVDGGLVGGSSLIAEEFSAIIKTLK
jgi:triosephosphate isomerase